MGEKLNFSTNLNNFHNVSLGQGQEVVAEDALDVAANNGHWVILQVSHLRFCKINLSIKYMFQVLFMNFNRMCTWLKNGYLL